MNRPVLSARVTAIESFRQYIEADEYDDKPWINETNVINTIKGLEFSNVKADYGSAGHAIIENPGKYRTTLVPDPNEFNTIASASDMIPGDEPVYGYRWKNFTFTDKQARPLLKHAAEHPLWCREVPLAKLYHTPNFDLILTGTTDCIEGTQLRDTKFKFSSFEVSDFMLSFQWRAYLDMVGLNTFVYDFFKVSGFDGIEDCDRAVISEVESMTMFRYPEMQQDIQSTINEFASFVTFKGLTQYLAIDAGKARKIVAGNSSLRKYISL